MKKTNFLKFALTLVMAFVMTSAWAQIPGEDVINYVSAVDEPATQVTVGKTIPLYAMPDIYFSPTYDPATGTGIGVGQTWAWSVSGAEITLAGATANYVQLTGATAGGPYTVSVVESGTCGASTVTSTLAVSVLNTPTVSITTPAADITACSGAGSLTTPVQITIGANGASYYRLAWTLEIYTIGGTPAVADEWFDTDLTTLGAAQAFAESYTLDAPAAFTNSGAQTLLAGMPATFGLIGGKPTVYVITITAINDIVTRRGDFLAIDAGVGLAAASPDDFMYYDVAGLNPLATTAVRTITVNPNPTTGPIYHISNSWAQ